MWEHFERVRIEVEELLEAGDQVVAVTTLHAVPKRGQREMTFQIVEVYTIRDGLEHPAWQEDGLRIPEFLKDRKEVVGVAAAISGVECRPDTPVCRVESHSLHVFTFRDGKVARCEVLKTKAEPLEAAGVSE